LSACEVETLKSVMKVSGGGRGGCEDRGESAISELITHISYILCYPFAIFDANEENVSRAYTLIKEFNLFSKLLDACVSYRLAATRCDVPVSLLTRLVLGDEDLARMIVDRLLDEASGVCDFFAAILHNNADNSSETLIADVLTMLSHLCRRGDDALAPVMRMLRCSCANNSGRGNGSGQQANPTTNGDYQIIVKYLLGDNPLLKSKCCNMIGNMMRHNDSFYEALRDNKAIVDCMLKCCQLDELNVRKVNGVNIYSIVNSGYTLSLL
jgi:hypothetical protein